MKYMYFKSWPVTLIEDAGNTSFFRHQRLVLGVGSAEAALLKVDEAGSVLESRGDSLVGVSNYSPYGHTLSPTDIGFKGEWFNRFSRSYPLGNGYRDYSAVLMRFRSPDSLSPMGDGGINPYAFVSNDPVNWSDPSGHRRILYSGIKQTTITEITKGVFRKKRELYITGHGSLDSTKVKFDGVGLSPEQLFEKAKEKGVSFEVRKGDRTRPVYDRVIIAACYSAGTANDRGASFAQKFADKVGSRVRGYEGAVRAVFRGDEFHQVTSWTEPKYRTGFNYKPFDFSPRITDSNSTIRNR
ncbi:MAG: RHS repeat-associated core domain-containing protein [Candidatus Pseudomonas phytovorans]|uniref:RHS repeat-associated core domain-containing protein n=1 Tax=Candidatus Pseudomonas phytovorans TaxID=3121377 RepID=A0AAJ6BDV1_9PSED|nr:RHS repeat-associated core domain-containing protein [Pseudomonas sp.]WEK31161.1 MAG: RHS repeat-associated core domain-containing protein [Pseudomonas sp.]